MAMSARPAYSTAVCDCGSLPPDPLDGNRAAPATAAAGGTLVGGAVVATTHVTCRVVWRLTDPEVAVISAVAPTPGSVVSVALASPPLVRTEGVMEPVEDENSTTVPLGTGWPSPSTTLAMTCTVLPQLMLAADRDRLIW